MEEIVKICFLALAVVVVAGLLQQEKKEYGFFLAVGFGTYVFSVLLHSLYNGMGQITALWTYMGDYDSFLILLLRISVIACLCQFCSEMCKDAGFQSMASWVEMIGKVYILFSGVPVLMSILEEIKKIM